MAVVREETVPDTGLNKSAHSKTWATLSSAEVVITVKRCRFGDVPGPRLGTARNY